MKIFVDITPLSNTIHIIHTPISQYTPLKIEIHGNYLNGFSILN